MFVLNLFVTNDSEAIGSVAACPLSWIVNDRLGVLHWKLHCANSFWMLQSQSQCTGTCNFCRGRRMKIVIISLNGKGGGIKMFLLSNSWAYNSQGECYIVVKVTLKIPTLKWKTAYVSILYDYVPIVILLA